MTMVVEHKRHCVAPLTLRLRLFRRVMYRGWKSIAVQKAKRLIAQVHYQTPLSQSFFTPVIVLSTYTKLDDLLILSYLFRDKELTFLHPENMIREGFVDQILSSNFTLSFKENQSNFHFFRELLSILKDFNRSVVISPNAAKIYAKNILINPGMIAKIAMKASVPIVPVILKWRSKDMSNKKLNISGKKCHVYIGDKLYVSPSTSDFKDIFFARRGIRKFERLTSGELNEIGNRIFSKLEMLGN